MKDEASWMIPEIEANRPAPDPSSFSLHPSSFLRHRFAFALLTLLASGIFVRPLVQSEVFVLRDHFDYVQPLRWFTTVELRAGRLPLWNPYNASGEPWLANPQTGVFYPPAWIFLVLPFATAYMLYLFFHLVLLGCSSYLLFARRLSAGAALVGATAVMFSGPVLSLFDLPGAFGTLAWIPAALWCALNGAWKRGGVVLALAFLAGEPFFAALAALMYALARRRRDVAGTAALAAGLCAVQLLPFLEFAVTSDRVGAGAPAAMLAESMSLSDWLRAAVPPAFPGAIDPLLDQHFIPMVYVGIAVLFLAATGVVWGRNRRAAAAWLALLAAAVVISLGPDALAELPVMFFRYPARVVPIAALALAALAAAGWDRIRPGPRWADLIVVFVIVADLLSRAGSLFITEPFRRDVVPYAAEIGARSKIVRVGAIDAKRSREWIAGYLNLYDRRYDAFTPAPLADAGYVRAYREMVGHARVGALASANVEYVIADRLLEAPFRAVASRSGLRVYRNASARPMATIATAAGTRGVPWTVDSSRATVTVDAAGEGLVVLRQQAARGWSVTVDGKGAEPLVVNGLFRAVRVPPGPHEIVWTYRPRSLPAGAAMTLVTLTTLGFLIFVKRSRASRASKNFSSCPSNLE